MLDAIGELNLKGGVEALALEAAGARAVHQFMRSFEILPEIARAVVREHQEFLQAKQAQANTAKERVDEFDRPNRNPDLS